MTVRCPALNPRDEIDELFGRANPNPDRIGCLPREVLIALARRERPIGDPAYQHLIKCSPCYLEVRGFQEAEKEHRRRGRLLWGAAAAAVVLIAVLARRMSFWGNDGGGERATQFRIELDLRPYAPIGGASQGDSVPPLPLQRGHGTLTMVLPTGSEPGRYEVQVLDSQLRSKVSSDGIANVRNHATRAQTTLDLQRSPQATTSWQLDGTGTAGGYFRQK